MNEDQGNKDKEEQSLEARTDLKDLVKILA